MGQNLSQDFSNENLIAKYSQHIKRLAGQISKKYQLPPQDYQDLIQEGLIALFQTRENFNEQKNNGFWFYAKKRIRGAMLDWLKSKNFIHIPKSFYNKIKSKEYNIYNWKIKPILIDIPYITNSPESLDNPIIINGKKRKIKKEDFRSLNPEDYFINKELKEKLKKSLAVFFMTHFKLNNDIEKKIIKLKILEKCSEREIAKKLKISRYKVRKIEDDILHRHRIDHPQKALLPTLELGLGNSAAYLEIE